MSSASVSKLVRHTQDTLALQQRIVPHVFSDSEVHSERYEVARTLGMLFQYLLDRGQAVLGLLANRLDWDAEIVLRTYYECALKILFIALSPATEQVTIVWEFWVPLGQAADRKTARKAGFAEQAFPEADHEDRNVFRLLQDPRMVRDSLNLTRAVRRRLAQKWSFSELIEALAAMERDGRELAEVRSLLHVYGMSSHLAHADCNAMDLMTDRALRDRDELPLLQDAHAARIATDLLSIGWFCTHAICGALHAPSETLGQLRKQLEVGLTISEEITKAFHKSQRSFYDAMLGTPPDPD